MSQTDTLEYYAVEFVSNTTTTTTTTVCNNGSFHDMANVLHNNWKKVFDNLIQLNNAIERCTQSPSDMVGECTKARDGAVTLLNDINSVLFQYQQAQQLQRFFASRSAPSRGSPPASSSTIPDHNKRQRTSPSAVKREPLSQPSSPIVVQHQTRPVASPQSEKKSTAMKMNIKEEPIDSMTNASSPSPSRRHLSKRSLSDLLN